jgi:hypothetical protein
MQLQCHGKQREGREQHRCQLFFGQRAGSFNSSAVYSHARDDRAKQNLSGALSRAWMHASRSGSDRPTGRRLSARRSGDERIAARARMPAGVCKGTARERSASTVFRPATLFARQPRRVTATAIKSGASSPFWRWRFPRREFYEIPFRWSARDGDAEALRRLEIE